MVSEDASLFKDRRIVRLGQISRYGDDLAICLARNLGRCCFQRLPATRTDRNTPSVVACPQNRASRSARACRSGFSKSPVSRVTETSAINTPRSVGCCRCAKSRTEMAGPDGPVELTRAPAAAAPTAAHAAGGTLSMTSRSVARSSVSPRLRWRATCRAAVRRRPRPLAARLSRWDHRRRFLARADRNARAASVPRIQCGTASAAAGSGSPRR